MKQTVHIIGGGLAGLSLALGLRRQDVPVVVHEAGNYPRHRVCGEFILGVTDADLDLLGISDALADARRHDVCAWFAGNTAVANRHMPLAARAISRFRLDDRLANMARQNGVELRCGERLNLPREAGWVQAAGRVKQARGNWLGLKAHYRNLPLAAGLEMHLGHGGYVGLTAVEDGRVNVCALLPQSTGAGGNKLTLLPQRLRDIGLSAISDRLLQAEVQPESITGVTHFTLGWQPLANSGEFVLGDSQAMIPPFTGAGMSMAFESAARSVPFLVDWAEGRSNWSEAMAGAQRATAKAFRPRMKWAHLVHRALLSRAGPLLLKASVGWRLAPFDSLVRVLRGA
jgi:flavin-dependent dehydrogenase